MRKWRTIWWSKQFSTIHRMMCLLVSTSCGGFVTEHVLVSSLVHHVMNQGPYHVQFGGGWDTIPLDPAVFGDRGRCDTARHLCPLCGHMSLRWEIYNVDNGRIWIRCTRFRRHGCTFQWYPPSNFWRSVRIQRRPQIPKEFRIWRWSWTAVSTETMTGFYSTSQSQGPWQPWQAITWPNFDGRKNSTGLAWRLKIAESRLARVLCLQEGLCWSFPPCAFAMLKLNCRSVLLLARS